MRRRRSQVRDQAVLRPRLSHEGQRHDVRFQRLHSYASGHLINIQSGTIAEKGAALLSLIHGLATSGAALALPLAEPELRPTRIAHMYETLDMQAKCQNPFVWAASSSGKHHRRIPLMLRAGSAWKTCVFVEPRVLTWLLDDATWAGTLAGGDPPDPDDLRSDMRAS